MSIVIRGDLDHLMAHQRLDELRQYLHVTEKYLHRAKTDFKAWSDEQVKKLPREQCDEYQDFHQDEYWRYEEKFPRVLRSSFLVSAISLFEYEMGRICGRLKRREPMQSSWTDSKGNLFERFKKYCIKAELPLSFDDVDWQEIKKYYLVRNCIVHTNGLLKEFNYKDRKSLIPYLKKKNIVSEDTIDEEIALTATFCEEVIKTMQVFMNNVYEAISSTRKNQESSNKESRRGAKPLLQNIFPFPLSRGRG